MKINIMNKVKKISKVNFHFRPISKGGYVVTYYSPLKKIERIGLITDMNLIELTKNMDYPKAKNLRILKNLLHK